MQNEILKHIHDYNLPSPLINSCPYGDEYDTLIEVWKDDRKLSIFLGDDILVLRIWGINIFDEMSEHTFTNTEDIKGHLDWLCK